MMSRIQFENRSGVRLTGNLHRPAETGRKSCALFAHCFTCGRDILAAREITSRLAEAGFAVLRFDFTGLGESEGDFSNTHFSSNLDDLEDAACWLGAKLVPPQLLVGHSLGGTACLAVAERLDSVRAVATIGAPSRPDNVIRHFDERVDEIMAEGSAEVVLAGRRFRIRRDFIEDAREHDLEHRIGRLGRSLLVMHSPVDEVVSIDHAQLIFSAARHPRSFVSLDDADHLLSKPADSHWAAAIIAAWSERFIDSGKGD